MAKLLQSECEALVATDGAAALKISASKPGRDAILLDIQMPDMDGYSVCKWLKNAPSTQQIQVIFVMAAPALEDALFDTALYGSLPNLKKFLGYQMNSPSRGLAKELGMVSRILGGIS